MYQKSLGDCPRAEERRLPRLVKPKKQELADVDLVEAYAAEGGISISVSVTVAG
jgi:hypothetical protein